MTAADLLDTAEVAEALGLTPSALRAMRARPERHRQIDGLPEPLRLVSGSPVWERRAVERWIAGRK